MLNKLVTTNELFDLLKSPFVNLAIVSETDRKKKNKIEVETGKVGFQLSQDECKRIYVYPICSLQEEFKEYSVISMLKKNPYLSQILNPKPETVSQIDSEDGFDFKE